MSYEHDLKKYRNINYDTRQSCSVCGFKNTVPVLELPALPLTEVFINQPGIPSLGETDQSLHCCPKCGHAQLQNVLDQSLLYSSKTGYEFRSSQSYTGRKTAEFFKQFLTSLNFKEHYNCALEVGCNDAYLLKELKPIAKELIGIDPILKGHEADINDEQVTVYGEFFESCNVSQSPDLVICKDVIEHVTDPKALIQELVSVAKSNALFLIQVPIWDKLVENYNFDHVFHQHLNYFSLASFTTLLESLGCSLIDWTVNEQHWNSAIFAFTNQTTSTTGQVQTVDIESVSASIKVFQHQMQACELALETAARQFPVYGYGAALMLPVIKYHFPNQLSVISQIFDDNPNRNGQYYLNSTTPIVSTECAEGLHDAAVMLTAFSSRLNAKRMLARLSNEIQPKQIYYPFSLLSGTI
ncbi:hypothetical protein JF50_11180 [Pseudoalteromonas luteoviolacea]|uniref:Methyltransferase putative zinc binding domain-containing protein n=1 Tax=Pseudoalteromonas luteoviolacea TaxID=43657 RepID=A0A0C1MKY0_9GAMM|nr:methyltransferase domain-containing protein [Pseudoalteromonas luteoviolacea]KID57719.1 hypothetical protein JF50_11180 [Pseudoalteromonas luteoviolacea]